MQHSVKICEASDVRRVKRQTSDVSGESQSVTVFATVLTILHMMALTTDA